MKTRVTFEPLEPDAREFLILRTGIDYTPFDFRAPCWVCATARNTAGVVLGVLLGEQTSFFEFHMTCAVDDPKIITRRLLHAIFSTFFSRAVRVTAMCRPENTRSLRGIQHLGFLPEGRMRLAIEGKWDALVFGMLREDCRWIRAPRALQHFAKAA
jgi:hypothetical protein